MVWTTAGTNRVCPRCLPLKGKIVGYTDESGVQIPPLHPRCRCVIDYREVSIDALLTPRQPQAMPNVTLPNNAGVCKNFDELKLYWAENYNVKVNDEIAKLHFESVREALSGVEAVLKEFPPAGLYLKEIGVISSGIMCVSGGYTKINFNPEYFTDPSRLVDEFESGYYIKNLIAFGAEAYEAGSLVGKWYEGKYGISAQKIILAAYGEIVRSNGFKPLKVLMKEVSPHAFQNSYSECLADAVADFFVNGEEAAYLSKVLWRILKEETKMVAYSELKMVKFSDKEVETYGLFDNWGVLIGVRDDAPADFKKAYEHDKKMYEDAQKRGLIL